MQFQTPIPLAVGGFAWSARLNRRSENVRVHPIVIPELELINVERKILVAYFMERADDAAL